jgi:hypothetical protein
MSPTTEDYDRRDALERRVERNRKAFFKAIEPFIWLVAAIIVVSICLFIAWLSGMIQ